MLQDRVQHKNACGIHRQVYVVATAHLDPLRAFTGQLKVCEWSVFVVDRLTVHVDKMSGSHETLYASFLNGVDAGAVESGIFPGKRKWAHPDDGPCPIGAGKDSKEPIDSFRIQR